MKFYIFLLLILTACSTTISKPPKYQPYLIVSEIKSEEKNLKPLIIKYFQSNNKNKVYTSIFNSTLTVDGNIKCERNVKYTVNIDIQEKVITFYFFNLENRSLQTIDCLDRIPAEINRFLP